MKKNVEKELVVLDSIKLETLKTKELKSILETLELNGKTLFVTAEDNETRTPVGVITGTPYSSNLLTQ